MKAFYCCSTESLRLASAFVLMLAVNGVHFLGFIGSTFIFEEDSVYKEMTLNANLVSQLETMYYAIVVGTFVTIAALCLALNDSRGWFYSVARVMKELDIKAASLQNDPRCSTSLRVFDNGSVPTEAETFVHLYKVRCFGNRILFHRKCIPCLQTLRAKSHSGKHSDHNKLIIQMRLDNHAHDHSSNMLESGSLEKGGDKPSVAVVHDIGMTPRGNTASVESTGPSFSDANAEVEGRSSSKYAAYVSDEGKISVHLRQDKHVTAVPRVDICFDSLEGDLFVRPKSSRSVSVNMAPSKIVPMDLESTGGEV
jgi:hypothetical protein